MQFENNTVIFLPICDIQSRRIIFLSARSYLLFLHCIGVLIDIIFFNTIL